MAREFSVVVGINATKAIVGGRQFKTGADQVNRSNRGMQRSTATTTKRMTAMITTMGRFRGVASLMFAGFLGVGGIGAVIRTLSTFQTSMSAVTALVSAQNPRSLAASMTVLTERAREMGATTLFTASQAAEGMKFLTLAGFDVAEVYQAIGPALDLAAAGMLGLGQSADILSNIMSAFSVDAREAVVVADALAFTSARTNTNIQQLGEAMKFVGPVAGTLGVNVEETAVALGILGNSGLQASLAGTSLRRTMSGLLNPSKEATKIFGDLGVTQEFLVSTMQGPKGLVNLVNLLAEKGLTAAQAFTLFGQRGAPGLLSLINQRGDLEDLTKELDKAGGTAARMAKIMRDNLGGDARIAISSLQEAILSLGDSGLTDWLRGVVQGFTGFIRVLAGVVTPVDDLTAAMLTGINIATTMQENMGLLTNVVKAFTIYLFRNTIKAVTLVGWQLTVAAVKATGLATALFTTNTSLLVAARGAKVFGAALKAAGIGIALVAVVALVEWLMNLRKGEVAMKDFRGELRSLGNEAEVAAVRFDTLAEAGRKQQQVLQQERLSKAAALLKELTDKQKENQISLEGLGAARNAVAIAEAAESKANEARLASGSRRNEATRQWTIATNELKDARAELSAIEKLGGNGAIKLAADVEAATLQYREQAQLTADMIVVNQGLAGSIEELRKAREREASELEKENALHLRAFGISENEKKAVASLIDTYAKREVKLKELEAGLAAIVKTEQANIKALKDDGLATELLVIAKRGLEFQIRKTKMALTPFQQALKKSREITEDLKDEVTELTEKYPGLSKLQRQFGRDIATANLEFQAGTLTIEQYIERVKLLRDLFIANGDDICEKNKEVRKCTDDSVSRMTEIWKQGMRNIQDAWADAFKDMLDGSGNFFDGILDAFKDMIANMIAAWVGSGLLNLFAGNGFSSGGNGFGQIFAQGVSAFGGGGGGGGGGGVFGAVTGGSSSGGSGGGLLSSVFGTGGSLEGVGTAIQGAFQSLTMAIGAFGQGVLSGLAGGGGAAAVAPAGTNMTFATSGFTGAQNAAINNPASFNAGNAVAGAGYGLLAGTVVDAIVGGRGNPVRGAVFAAIGGIIGNYIFPVVGGLIGGAIGALVDNIIGGAKKLESATLQLSVAGDQFIGSTETIISTQRSWFRGRDFETTTRNITASLQGFEDLFGEFAMSLKTQAEDLGGSTDFLDTFQASGTFSIKGKSEAQIRLFLTQFMDRVLKQAINEFLRDVEGLSDHVLRTLQSFRGNVEEFLQAFSLLGSLDRLFNIDLVEASTEAITESQINIIDAYQNSLAAYREVVEAYDGSLDSLTLLTQATAIFTQQQLDLITIYQQVGEQISGMFQGSAQTIREAMLSEEELYNLRRSQIDDLVEQATMTTDPGELSRIAAEINRLGLDAFSMLDQSQIDALGPEFIEFFEGLDELFGDQIETGISDVVQDQADLELEVAARLEEAAQAIITAANAARDLFLEEQERRRDGRYFEYAP